MATLYPVTSPKNNALTQADLANLAKSWITPDLAQQAGIYRVDRHDGAAIIGRKSSGDYAGIVFPYFWPGKSKPREYRLRRDNPDIEYAKDGKPKEKGKYLSPPGGSNMLYFAPNTEPFALTDISITVVITEGEKKTLALSRLAVESNRRWLPIGLSGVWNWRGVIGKETGPNGDRRDVKGPILDLNHLVWRGRDIYIVFDANVGSNDSVRAARRELAKELQQRGASVRYVNIEPADGINGIDDLLAISEPSHVLELFEAAQTSEGDLTRFRFTDAGNADAFAYLYGDRLRYDHKRGRWLLWRDHWWRADADGELYRLAIKAARELYAQASTVQDLKEREEIAKWAIRSEARAKAEARIAMAQNIKPIAEAGDNWNADPYLLGVGNGVLDLRTGELRPGEPNDLITHRTSIPYDPNAEWRLWQQTVEEIFSGDVELLSFIQRAVGYSLTGLTSEQVLFICHGKGANGKTLFLGVLRHVLNEYAYNAPFSTFELNQRAAIPNDVAALDGRRLVVSSETNEGSRLNEARIKALTGCDPITARYLHKEFFTFDPVAKFWLAVNHLPKVNDDSDGFWRRVRLIPFRQQFTGDNCDRDLERKLQQEAIGILAWAVRGCLEWQQKGLEPPTIVTQATQDYRTDSDILAAFLDECCITEPDKQVGANDLFIAYDAWAERNKLRDKEKLSQTAFGRRMRDRFEKRHGKRGAFYYGLGLIML